MHHEPGFKGAHNYQVESQGYNRDRGRGRGGLTNTWMRDQSNYDGEAYSEHHKTLGHSTAQCRVLNLKLAAKLPTGKLKADINIKDFELDIDATNPKHARDEHSKQRRRDNEPKEGGPCREILMIMGGSQSCSNTVTSIKAYQQRAEVDKNLSEQFKFPNDVISFKEEETTNIDRPHNDPPVVKLIVNNCNLSRTLIDTGSSLDLIFHDTLQRMNIDLDSLEGGPKPVTRFSEETTLTIGTIKTPY